MAAARAEAVFFTATRGRQGRFLILTLLCWSAARAFWLWPPGSLPASAWIRFAKRPASPTLMPTGVIGERPWQPIAATAVPRGPSKAPASPPLGPEMPALSRDTHLAEAPVADTAIRESLAPAPLFPPRRPPGRKIEAQAYLYWRPGGTTSSLAEHGELGGSQFAARIAVPLGHGLAAAGRVYAPLEHLGAEGAIGLDWHPLPGQPLRISVEQRQRLNRLGRSAWSAYAAGGFWRGGGPGTAQIDGYAQAGVVGTQRRDLFIDGALRIGYRLPTPKLSITVGAGLWGAAQPQVSRIDAGPRLAIVLPVEGHALTFAVDGRFRMAGHAAPGSGAAMTLAADF